MNDKIIEENIREAANHIPVPDSLSAEEIEKKLRKQKQKQPRFTPTKGRILATAASFALVVIAVAGILALSSTPLSDSFLADDEELVVTKEAHSSSALDQSNPKDYHKLCEHLNAIHKEQQRREKQDSQYDTVTEAIEEESSSGSADDSSSYSETDLQVEGVMEADVVKTDGSYLYTLSHSYSQEGEASTKVQIYSVSGKKVKKISSLRIPQITCKNMYLENGTLILLYSEDSKTSVSPKNRTKIACEDTFYPFDLTTGIRIYDVSDPYSPKEKRYLTQSGSYQSSRIHDGYLYTFSNYYVSDTNLNTKDLSRFVPQAADSFIPADRIHISSKNKTNYLVMTSLKLSDLQDFADSAALLGGGDTQYMNRNHIYTVENYLKKSTEYSIITKYCYENGTIQYSGKAKVKGGIYDSYYMHEYNRNFVFVYTQSDSKNNFSESNGLCVLDDKMKLQGKIEKLGIDETIYASYFIDHMAYFVTFRNTDPVFAVDIRNPKEPKLCSQLKLPGFSSYLHSFGEHTLLGIGNGNPDNTDTDYTKLSLFTIHADNTLQETATIFPEKGCPNTSYAANNHKCVFVDEERGLVGLVIERFGKNYYGNKTLGNYVVYQKKGTKLKKVLSVPIKQDADSPIADIRGVRIDHYFYLVIPDEGVVKVFDINTWKNET